MNKSEIKNAIGKLAPDKDMEYRISEKVLKKHRNKFPIKRMLSIAASLIVVITLGVIGRNLFGERANTSSDSINIVKKETNTSTGTTRLAEGIYIPKIELPKDTNKAMKMIALIVYQGRIYTQTDTKISLDSVEKIRGEKLGTTKGNIDEWSSQKDYAVEFASTIGEQDVYAVKGYEKSFRIMTYGKVDGNIYAEFFECFNGITVKSGADIFDRLKIENSINSVKYEEFDSWNNTKQQYKVFTKLQVVNSFVSELKNATPYKQEDLSYLFDENGEAKQKFIYLTLNDGSEVSLRLFKEGYIFYSNSHLFFKMDSGAFNKLWNELK
jgi:hypothetical protein